VAVLRVTTLYAHTAAATAAYYTRYLTEADGEQPGRWTGRQAGLLGLSGEVTTEALEALLEGRDPIGGSRLGYPLLDRVTTSGKVVRAVAGFDATLSAPKSLSVWWALSGDEGLAECHDGAVAAVVEWVERYGSTTRIRCDGRRLHPDSQGLTVAVFRQTTSRLDDPQLHSHVVISAKVQTDDGRWLALDARSLKGYQRALGGLYQSVLRAELTSRYGVTFGELVNGQAEIAGVPVELLECFSKRTAEVERAFQVKLAEFHSREGRDPTLKERGALGREAAEDTRGHKTGHGVPNLRSRWLAEADAIGITPASLCAGIEQAAQARPPQRQQVVIEDVIDAVAQRRSAWHQCDVLQAICDVSHPQPGVAGELWAAVLDRAVEVVLEHCVDLDPTESHTRRRASDGRSVWIEPSARHHTSDTVLAQEEHILSWAIDAQLEPPQPSTTVGTDGLDLFQAEAAAHVAGVDRLVVVVGPAGAGKTTMLSAAGLDLASHGRLVFGVAPTAKAARVLETETGMASDTVAKLVHEWTRADRPPEPVWRLPAGTTLIVDEAGMLATGDFHTLTELADHERWRLVLVGDPRQLQAVGRGGMFAELCATARSAELGTVHRFRHEWEAAASLKLRYGDPEALAAYVAHDRIVAAPFAEHLERIAVDWADHHAQGRYTAITSTTNQHVHAINGAIQQHRRQRGELDDPALDLADSTVHVGEIVVTRRNDRQLRTSTGDNVRNRDYWTVDAITVDGGLAVTRIDGHGTITLPPHYARQHVHLGYAATEPGNQAETADRSLTLATPATTGRGLYVAVTRGRDDNQILVVADTHNVLDAVDTLQQILTNDRADTPAVGIRRELAAAVPSPPTLQPRCQIPAWFADTYRDAIDDLADARHAIEQHERADADIQRRLSELADQLRQLEPVCEPHDRAIADAHAELDTARNDRRLAERDLANSGVLGRRAARRELADVTGQVNAAQAVLDDRISRAEPILTRRSELEHEYRQLRDHLRHDRWLLRSIDRLDERIDIAQHTIGALNTWNRWAAGKHVTIEQLAAAVGVLGASDRSDHAHLAEPVHFWAQQQGLRLAATREPPSREIAVPAPELW
jgi:conjugative relaxase-like TrwC/TraI family protein